MTKLNPLPMAEVPKSAAVPFIESVTAKAADVGQMLQSLPAPQRERIEPMWPLDRTILMRDTTVVAAWGHGIMGAQGFVAQGPVGVSVAFEVAESGRQAVTAMLARGTAQHPQGILQAFGQCHKAFTTQHDMDMFEAAIS